MNLHHRSVRTDKAPAAIGPYSQAIVVEELGLVFTSGQIGLDPDSGELVSGGIEEEFRRVLANLEAVLLEAGSGLDRIVRAGVYMTDLSAFATVNRIYGEAVGDPLPARSAIGVAALPKGARVEVDLVATLRPREADGRSGD
ncbi:MAG: reactive intermediate/imine deaminase [Candidatus Eisenbacteria bacterium]|nr:reactive intermediate/imine deaminase [Candidatus Latescibacterota bacterium]MBD3301030.1 reactive intermediate/imine deaminase [Candidatus Eisenbacteria bacterium]